MNLFYTESEFIKEFGEDYFFNSLHYGVFRYRICLDEIKDDYIWNKGPGDIELKLKDVVYRVYRIIVNKKERYLFILDGCEDYVFNLLEIKKFGRVSNGEIQ